MELGPGTYSSEQQILSDNIVAMPYIEMLCSMIITSEDPFIREFNDSHAGHMLAMFCTHHEQKCLTHSLDQ